MTAYTEFSDVPRKKYGVIYLDPAWRFTTYAPPKEGQKGRRDAERHYPTMSHEEMRALPIKDVAGKNCFMMMWTSWPHLPKAMDLMQHYGFRYTSSFVVWVKTKRSFPATKAFIENPTDFHTGTGYSSRKNVEILLLGRRGSPKRQARDVRELLVRPVRQHSRKPDEVYGLIERFANGPYLEMNARNARPNWDQWGNQVEMFAPAPAIPRTPLEEIAAQPVPQDLFQSLEAAE